MDRSLLIAVGAGPPHNGVMESDVDLVINNASVVWDKSVLDQSEDDWDR